MVVKSHQINHKRVLLLEENEEIVIILPSTRSTDTKNLGVLEGRRFFSLLLWPQIIVNMILLIFTINYLSENSFHNQFIKISIGRMLSCAWSSVVILINLTHHKLICKFILPLTLTYIFLTNTMVLTFLNKRAFDSAMRFNNISIPKVCLRAMISASPRWHVFGKWDKLQFRICGLCPHIFIKNN